MEQALTTASKIPMTGLSDVIGTTLELGSAGVAVQSMKALGAMYEVVWTLHQ